MNTSTSCPDSALLRRLLNGDLEEAQQVELSNHLESCASCQQRMDDLAAGRDSWSDARQLSEHRPAHDAELGRVMRQLKAQAGHRTHAELEPDDEVPLHFLSPPQSPDQLGLLGPYQVLEVIGRGGMGIVLKAFDPSLQRIVAIKVLAPHLAMNAAARRRFKREAQAAAAVSHDHVVTIHAVDEANGVPYLVMQYVAGMSLQECIDRSAPLRLKEILRIGMQTASGLAAAHAQGLIHRDIKPSNILLENHVQRVKITDFGLARATDDAAALTQSGVIAGTPQYMAPEQARGEELDARADLFSLGSVLYAMCTGRPPFGESSALAVLRRVTDAEPRPIAQINQEIPHWLVDIIAKLHAKNTADRYQSASEVAEELGQRLAEVQQAGWTPPPSPPIQTRAESAPTVKPVTTVTVCPLCACHLHIPDRMVGQTVNCPECGKPFRVEEGTEEIDVLRGLHVNGPRPAAPNRKTSAWVMLVICLIVFPVVLLVFVVPFFAFSWLLFRGSNSDKAPAAMQSVVPHGDLPGNGAMQTVERLNAHIIRMNGEWEATALVEDGIVRDDDKLSKIQWVFKDGTYTLHRDNETEQGRFTVDAGKDPKWIDLTVTSEPTSGGTYMGIYTMTDDDLVICLAPMALFAGSVRERPTELSAKPGTNRTLYVLKRKEP
jgi:uncharacterized protein (TIGR03067 family)